jgi:hypothetical protein
MDALLEGAVVGVTNGCFTVGSDSEAMTLVFPANLVMVAEQPGVFVHRGIRYAAGDRITVGGVWVPDYDVPAGCPTDAWIINPSG